jgi:hypothetical protein
MSGSCEGTLSEARAAYDLRLAPGFRRLPVYGARRYEGSVTLVEHDGETLYEADRFIQGLGSVRIANGAAPSAEDAVWLAVGFLIGGEK